MIDINQQDPGHGDMEINGHLEYVLLICDVIILISKCTVIKSEYNDLREIVLPDNN